MSLIGRCLTRLIEGTIGLRKKKQGTVRIAVRFKN